MTSDSRFVFLRLAFNWLSSWGYWDAKHFSSLSLLFKMLLDAWVTASLLWPGCLTSDERWTVCWRIVLQPGRLRRSGTGWSRKRCGSCLGVGDTATFYFRVQKDKKQTSLTVWPLLLLNCNFLKNKALIIKEVVSSKGEHWPVLQKAYDFQTSALVYTIKQCGPSSSIKPTQLLFAQLSMCEFPLFYNVKSSNEEAGKALYKFNPLLSACVGTTSTLMS